LRAFADLLLEAFRADVTFAAHEIDAKAAVERLLHMTRDNPIVTIPADFVLLGRVFTVLGGLLMRYRPRVNLFQLFMPQLLRAIQTPNP
jgi:predicted unusual protein kinase regulating ubiquinone biosynthesis (AarF/ABC1/UbiB family)